MTDLKLPDLAPNMHGAALGGSQRGKSGLAQILVRRLLRFTESGVGFIDPHSTSARATLEFMSNPRNGVSHRQVHVIDPISSSTASINPIEPHSPTPEGWADAAEALTSIFEARFGGAAETTPRLARITYLLAFLCARHECTMIEMLQLISITKRPEIDDLRRRLLEDFPATGILRQECEDLFTLDRRQLLELTESLRNRLTRWLIDRRLVRILCRSKGLSPLKVMDNAEVLIASLAGVSAESAALIGTVITTLFSTSARHRFLRREPGAPFRLFVDEAEAMCTIALARGLEQTAKAQLTYFLMLQHMAQTLRRTDDFLSSLLNNCRYMAAFGSPKPDDASFIADIMNAGTIRLDEWKVASTRPTIIGNRREQLHSSSQSEMQALQAARSTAATQGRSRGASLSLRGNNSVFLPPMSPQSPALVPLLAMSSVDLARSQAEMDSRAEMTGSSTGEVKGKSHTDTSSESIVPVFQDLPQVFYTLDEQREKNASEILSLPPRHCLIRVDGGKPLRLRTPNLAPAYNSESWRETCLPRYLERLPARSGQMLNVEAIDREIEQRLETLTHSIADDNVDFAEPESGSDDPFGFGRNPNDGNSNPRPSARPPLTLVVNKPADKKDA